jgi:Flp pilus assembly CpaE family ATPase
VAGYLGISGQYGLADVLSRQGQIDDELVISTAVAYSPRLHVLLSPASVSPSDPPPLQYDRLETALEVFQLAYGHTVIDAARVPLDVAASLATASRLALLVLQLNIKDLARARAILGALNRRGVPSETVVPLVNRYHRHRHMVGLEEAQKALATSVRRVSNDFASAMRSANYGQPLAQVAPRSSLRRDLQGLALEFVRSHSREPRGGMEVRK